MADYPVFFFTLGGLFLLGLMTDLLGRKTALPRVSLLLLFGVLVGPELSNIPEIGERWFPIVADMALVMIGFLLGGQLAVPFLKSSGRQVLWISISVIVGTAILVTAGMLLIGQSLPVALLLGAVATSTDPAATLDVVHETSAGGTFTETMIGIAGIDDL